jgi:hypothetical protein
MTQLVHDTLWQGGGLDLGHPQSSVVNWHRVPPVAQEPVQQQPVHAGLLLDMEGHNVDRTTNGKQGFDWFILPILNECYNIAL